MMQTSPKTTVRTHYMFRGLIRGFEGFTQVIIARTIRCGPAQKHQQGPITCSKWSNDAVKDKGIERGNECIGFEGFNQDKIARTIGVSRGDPSTSYPCAREVQYNIIWAMK